VFLLYRYNSRNTIFFLHLYYLPFFYYKYVYSCGESIATTKDIKPKTIYPKLNNIIEIIANNKVKITIILDFCVGVIFILFTLCYIIQVMPPNFEVTFVEDSFPVCPNIQPSLENTWHEKMLQQ
jgi:hypothetical protein